MLSNPTHLSLQLTNLIQKIRQSSANRPLVGLLTVWLLSMIGLPIAKWTWGDIGLLWSLNLNVLIQVALVVWVMVQAWGIRKTTLTVLIVTLVSLMVEAIGTATGYPFGVYHYTEKLQPQLAHGPLLIPLAWLMMLPVAWCIAGHIVGRTAGLTFLLVSAFAMTAWDLFLDPQMVAWGYWVWTPPGGYFGIPYLNYGGWLLTTFIITLLVRPAPLPKFPLFAVYVIIWILQTLGQLFFWGLIGPALVGFVGMGIFVGLVIWRSQTVTRLEQS